MLNCAADLLNMFLEKRCSHPPDSKVVSSILVFLWPVNFCLKDINSGNAFCGANVAEIFPVTFSHASLQSVRHTFEQAVQSKR